MAKLLVKYVGTPDQPSSTLELDNVVDAGIANDFLVVRYTDGVVTFTKTEHIDSAQFDPTGDTDNLQPEGEPDPSVQSTNNTAG